MERSRLKELLGKEVLIGHKHAQEYCYTVIAGKKGILRELGDPRGNPVVAVNHGKGDWYGWHVCPEDIHPVGAIDNEVGLLYIERSDPFA